MKTRIFLLLFASTFINAQFIRYAAVKEVHVKDRGVVVSAHPLASEAGARMLRNGGNSFDAAIATQLALAVVYPQAGNLGGGGFMVATTKKGEKIALDFRETAPARAHKDMYLDKKGEADTNLSQNGRLAVGIPGSVAGIAATLKYAKLTLKELTAPAIELAQKGFAVTEAEAGLLNAHRESFVEHNTLPVAFVKDTPWKAGDLLLQPELASTLIRIRDFGEKGFYEGQTAAKMVAEMQRGNGIINAKDLKNYKVKWRKPLKFNYKGHEIVSMPLPSSGGLLLAQMLTMASFENLAGAGHNSPRAVQVMVEAERRAFADRAEYMGDPDFISDRSALLLSESYLKERWKTFSPEKATPSSAVGKIINPASESTETTHISILDTEGNAVAVTTTLNGLYGSKVVVAGAGFFLNNEMDDFSVKPGVPNMFGAVGGAANAIAPGKRMLSSMTPTVVLKDNKPFMVVGTPGGTTIPTSVFQSIVNVIDFGLNANFAVNAPKFHHQWLPETVSYEKGFSPETIRVLKDKGYLPQMVNKIGRTELILVNPDGTVQAVADGRGDDSVGVE